MASPMSEYLVEGFGPQNPPPATRAADYSASVEIR